jgi:hypothetical protein
LLALASLALMALPYLHRLLFVLSIGLLARRGGLSYIGSVLLACDYAVKTFRAAIKNYELTSSHHGSVKGYESYANITMKEEDVERPKIALWGLISLFCVENSLILDLKFPVLEMALPAQIHP